MTQSNVYLCIYGIEYVESKWFNYEMRRNVFYFFFLGWDKKFHSYLHVEVDFNLKFLSFGIFFFLSRWPNNNITFVNYMLEKLCTYICLHFFTFVRCVFDGISLNVINPSYSDCILPICIFMNSLYIYFFVFNLLNYVWRAKNIDEMMEREKNKWKSRQRIWIWNLKTAWQKATKWKWLTNGWMWCEK